MANAVRMGDRLMAGLRKLEAKHACIGEVRGRRAHDRRRVREGPRAPGSRRPSCSTTSSWAPSSGDSCCSGRGRARCGSRPPLVVDEQDVDTALAIIDGLLGELD